MTQPIPKMYQPVVDQGAVARNKEHWPAQVEGFLEVGYGGEKTRLAEERRRDPSGQEHAPPSYCYKLAEAWCGKIDEFISAYFLLPRGSFIDKAYDASAKDKMAKKGGT
jgi:hypothetical protein